MTFKRSICVKILFLATVFNVAPAISIDLEAERMIDNLANLQFDKLGSPQIKTDSIKPVLAPADRPHRLLVIAVEFPEIGYQRFV
jgi:immune inhibitor A